MHLVKTSRRHVRLPNLMRSFPPDANDGCDASGQKIDFVQTKSDRLASGDPRLSIEDRHPNHGTYVIAVVRAAVRLH